MAAGQQDSQLIAAPSRRTRLRGLTSSLFDVAQDRPEQVAALERAGAAVLADAASLGQQVLLDPVPAANVSKQERLCRHRCVEPVLLSCDGPAIHEFEGSGSESDLGGDVVKSGGRHDEDGDGTGPKRLFVQVEFEPKRQREGSAFANKL